MTFLHTLTGMYFTQTLLHSFLILVIVEISFFAWNITDHLSKFRYRLLTLTLPVFMFPVYQLLSPERGGWRFRLSGTLFDSLGWLDMRLWGMFPFALLLLAAAAGFTLIFFIQEILPLLLEKRAGTSGITFSRTGEYDAQIRLLLDRICSSLRVKSPEFMVVSEPCPILFTRGVKNHTIVISDHLVKTLNAEQLRGALTHEVVHIARSSSLKTQIIYLLRMLMFYNPVSLVEFRRIVHDDEFICDEITVAETHNPEALIEAISSFRTTQAGATEGLHGLYERVESHSYNLMLEGRIKRLREIGAEGRSRFRSVPYALTACIVVVMGYLVV